MSFEIDTDAAGQCSTRLKQLQERAANIAKLAEDADPELTAWGTLGLQLFAPGYWALAAGVHRHLQMVEEGLEKHAGSLDTCFDNYRAQEQAVTDALKGIERSMKAGF